MVHLWGKRQARFLGNAGPSVGTSPRTWALSTVARVGAEAVDAFVLGWWCTTFVSFMRPRAFPAVLIFVAAAAALVPKFVTTKTPYRFLVWVSWHHSLIEDIHTLFQDCVGRLCAVVLNKFL